MVMKEINQLGITHAQPAICFLTDENTSIQTNFKETLRIHSNNKEIPKIYTGALILCYIPRKQQQVLNLFNLVNGNNSFSTLKNEVH